MFLFHIFLQTFDKAKIVYLQEVLYDEMKWWHKLLTNFSISRYGTESFNRIKEIQQGLIYDIMDSANVQIAKGDKNNG